MRAPAFVLGFHGCDEKTGEAILDGHKIVEVSEKDHHWLGAGAYFWENDPARALILLCQRFYLHIDYLGPFFCGSDQLTAIPRKVGEP